MISLLYICHIVFITVITILLERKMHMQRILLEVISAISERGNQP